MAFEDLLTSPKFMQAWDANVQGVRGFGVRALLFRAKPASDTSGFNADTCSWLNSDFVGYARLFACRWQW